jgi:hypothetical protein
MSGDNVDQLDEQIARMKGGGTLSEQEVKVLCDRVSLGSIALTCHDDGKAPILAALQRIP